jgi:hypothetical protein
MTESGRRAARYRVGSAVAFESEIGSGADAVTRVYVASLPDGPLLCLEGPAALIWTEAVAVGDSSVAARVADAVGVSLDEVAQDVARFLDDLVDRGLLVDDRGAGSAGGG